MLRAGLKNYVYSVHVFTEPTDGINWCCVFGSHYVVGAAPTLTLRFNWDSKCSMALNCCWFLLRNCIFTTANFVSEPLVWRRTRETRKEEADTEGIQTREDSRVNRLNNSWRHKKTSKTYRDGERRLVEVWGGAKTVNRAEDKSRGRDGVAYF